MPDSRSVLEILVDVKNAATGARDLRDVGKAADESGKGAQGAGGKLKSLAVAAGGLVAVKKGTDYMRSAVDASTTLARSTASLTRATGMDAQTASAWVSMAKSRGIETKQLTTSFTAFSKQIRAAEGGSKASVKAFKDLGIEASALKGMSFDQTLTQTADAFAKLPAGADKSAQAVKMFGKQGLALLPLLNLGSEGLAEQMDVMKKNGLAMDESGIKKGLELAKTQREMKATTDGLKVSIGTALMPAVTGVAQALLGFITPIAQLVTKTPMLGTAVVGLAVALGALVVVVKLAALAQLLFNSALLANPITWVVVGIIALVAAVVLAYNKIGWFRAGVDAAFSAVKAAVGAVVGAFRSMGSAVASVVSAAVGALGRVVSFVTGMPSKIGSVLSSMWNGLKTGVQNAVNAAIGELNRLLKAVTDIPGKVKDALGDIGSSISGAVGDVASAINPFAAGGTVPAGGTLALVGERGPELMQLPGGTRITPLAAGTPDPVQVSALGGGEIHIHLDVDGRELTHVVARETADQQARR